MLSENTLRRRAPAVDFDHSPLPATVAAPAPTRPRPPRSAVRDERDTRGTLDVWPIRWIRKFLDRRSADVQCVYLRWQIENGKRHIEVLKRSLKQSEHDVACLEVQLLVEEKRL
jgi:hypothetical protein